MINDLGKVSQETRGADDGMGEIGVHPRKPN